MTVGQYGGGSQEPAARASRARHTSLSASAPVVLTDVELAAFSMCASGGCLVGPSGSLLPNEALTSESPLATYSVLLALLLCNHCVRRTPLHAAPGALAPRNPYREALSSFTNSAGMQMHMRVHLASLSLSRILSFEYCTCTAPNASDDPIAVAALRAESKKEREQAAAVAATGPSGATFMLDFERLYLALAEVAFEEHCTLLLYMLLHLNLNVRAFILARPDVENLVHYCSTLLYISTNILISTNI